MATATQTRSSLKSRKSSYDPGIPGEIHPNGKDRFIVQSFRNPEESYCVDLVERTCTCHQHLYRIAPARENGVEADDCKHYKAAMAEQLRLTRDKAFTLKPSQIRKALATYAYLPEVEAVIREVLSAQLLTIMNVARETARSREMSRI